MEGRVSTGVGARADGARGQMSDERLEHLGATTGLIAIVAVGLATLAVDPMGGDAELLRGPMWLWWVLYATYLGAFCVDAFVPAGRAPWRRLAPFVVQLVAGIALFALFPTGWAGVVLVVTAASAAFTVSPRLVVAIVIGQTLLIAVVLATVGWHAASVVMNAVIYGSFQAFAGFVTLSRRREAEARAELTAAHEQLAATHAELRATTALLETSARSAERLRISRDLHDVVGHQLTALALELEVALHDADGATAAHVERARAVAKDLLRDVRTTVSELRVAPEGLGPALEELVRDLPGLDVQLSVEERVPVDEAEALTIVRTVQELVTNTLRHAGARTLTVDLVVDADGVRITARDDGHGVRTLVPGNGLSGLRERIEQHGGGVSFDPGGNGSGFAVDARLPAP